MSNTPSQNVGAFAFLGQFPLTAPDLRVATSPANTIGAGIVDIDDIATETQSEIENLVQDLTNRLIELPGSNLDFGDPNNRGIGIMSYLNAPTTRLVGLPGRIDAEYEQDPRVIASATTIAQQADGSTLISTQVQTAAGVFGLGWAWSQAGVVPLAPTPQG